MEKDDYRNYRSIFSIKLEDTKTDFSPQNIWCKKKSQAPHSVGGNLGICKCEEGTFGCTMTKR